MGIIHRSAIVSAAVFAPLVFVTAFSAGVSNAVECGWGTVFDPPTHLCGGAAATATAAATTASVERRYHPGLRGGLLRAHSRSVCPVGVRRYINLAAAFSWEPMTKGDDDAGDPRR